MSHFTARKLIVLLIGFIFLVALIGFTLSDRQNATLPEQIVKDTVGFAQSLVAKPAHAVKGIFDNFDSLLDTYEENKRLKNQLDRFAVLQSEAASLKAENEQLREFVNKEESLRAYDPLFAIVIARNPDQWEEKIIINKGTTHGIEKNMAVMSANGLVGKVTLVTPFTSEVELLPTQSTDYRVSAIIQGDKNVYGLIEGYDSERQELILKRIDTDIELKKGQQVVTSGLGGIFPKGLLIGEVTDVSTDDFGLTKMAYVKPTADFSAIDTVIVAKRLTTTVDGLDGNGTDEDLTKQAIAEEEE